MQVRIANRQDEKGIRELAEALSKKEGASFDIDKADSDLRNIDANYFGRHGLFLVVEDDGELKGFAGAKEKTEEVLEITRFQAPGGETESQDEMLKVIVNFAPRLLYHSIECGEVVDSSLLKKFKFEDIENSQKLKLEVSPDF